MVLYSVVVGGQRSGDQLLSAAIAVLHRTYSRKQESKADSFGLELVYEQYDTTNNVSRLFEVLQQQRDHSHWLDAMSTHPAPADRVKRLRQRAKELQNH